MVDCQKVYAMRHPLALILVILGFGGAIVSQAASPVSAAGPHVAKADVEGIIGPNTARFLSRAIDTATDEGARLLIVTLNTPGGLFDSTREMVESILESRIPIVVYVSPQGARAASAGTFLAAAAHIAAMAPISNIGAASPVGPDGDLPDTLESKANQDASALLRSIAAKRGRNVEALELTVTKAKSYSASEALKAKIIDLIANDINDLVVNVHGMTAQLQGGELVIDTANLDIVKIEKTIVEEFLGFLANPTVAFLLLALGFIGIFLEFVLGVGLILPGVTGIVLLLLAFVAAGQLPVNWGGIALIIAAMVLFYLELAVIPGTTVFGILGAVFFAVGGLLLFGDFSLPGFSQEPIETPNFSVNPLVVGVVVASVSGFFLFFVRDIMTSRNPGTSGTTSITSVTELIGQAGLATSEITSRGTVHLAGEYWSAVSDSGESIRKGEKVMVVDTDGVILKVFKAPPSGELEDDDGTPRKNSI